ncbi:MAG: PilZ domain-containing protein [Proteobacteria bacterium]|nr:PilZ domain-containing protein [Pseudomonadota bacterium]MBU1388882.1 PilZ domain-containing protein [Pseudomonadota bacterium]MBU1542263.1 PilZ domain-containing protein [Pseudomonadota bacterium]MBU2480447.1 PilZ domain-containing protein [Pseudomonadota bacterium]
MDKQSAEFNKLNTGPDQTDYIRKSFRVPVEDPLKVWVMINTRRYPVLDICFDGVRILINEMSEFQVEQSLSNCELTIFDVFIGSLQGRVIHVSAGENKALQCGIQWMDASENEAQKIFQIVSKMKNQLLTDDDMPFDTSQKN